MVSWKGHLCNLKYIELTALYILVFLISSSPIFQSSPLAILSKMAGIAFGRFDDSFSLGSFKAYLAEFISTLLFVFAGVGSAMAYS